MAFGGYDLNRGRVTDSLFEANQLEQNDAKRTGGGEICVSFASGSTVLRNVIQPNEQNEILMVDQAGGLKNQFDYQVYYPNGKQSTATDLIFYWGDTECDGLKAFQETSKQEIHATVAKATK